MTGREIVDLIDKLKEKGLSSDEIIEIIICIEKHEPEKEQTGGKSWEKFR